MNSLPVTDTLLCILIKESSGITIDRDVETQENIRIGSPENSHITRIGSPDKIIIFSICSRIGHAIREDLCRVNVIECVDEFANTGCRVRLLWLALLVLREE